MTPISKVTPRTMDKLDILPVASIHPDPKNPRTKYDAPQMAELLDSVKKHGILQPVLVRRWPWMAKCRTGQGCQPFDHKNGSGYELVAGHRRLKAAQSAGLKTIPAIIRTLTDQEALELQITENLQRADLQPLEEAEGFKRLMVEFKHTAEDIAAKVGKSKAYVYARLKLTELPVPVKKAIWNGELSHAIALLIARIPNRDLQLEAAKEILHGGETDVGGRMTITECMSTRIASAFIQENYMLLLSDAPFDPKDEKLCPNAGSCAVCPKRTGNQTLLFPDIKRADVCTDTVCFQAKSAAAWEQTKAEAKQKGIRALNENETKEVFPHGRDDVSYNSEFIALSSKISFESKVTWKTVAKAHEVHIVLARAPSGRVVELARKDDLQKALQKEQKVKPEDRKTKADVTTPDLRRRDEMRKQKQEAEHDKVLYRETMTALVAAVEQAKDFTAFMELVAKAVVHGSWGDSLNESLKRRNIQFEKNDWEKKGLLNLIGQWDAQTRAGFIFEVILGKFGWRTEYTDLKPAIAAYAVDSKAIEARVKAALAEKHKPKKTAPAFPSASPQ